MSGPYCGTCKHFYKFPISGDGECTDKSKVIFRKNGIAMKDFPIVSVEHYCINHENAKTTNSDLDTGSDDDN